MFAELTEVIRALENDEVLPCFQPIVELRTGRLTGFEVLARWQHPKLGLVLPENFITIAETNGLIGNLTAEVIRKAFKAARVLPGPLNLAINVSPLQMQYLSLPRQIREAADDARFPLNRVTIEITESALLNDLGRAKWIAYELKSMGCRLALDDFGTGYSSLAHLQALPFDELKIDRSFISLMTKTQQSRKIVSAIIGLSTSLGLASVGEGIETDEHAEMLLSLGCDRGQGWLYGRPVLAEALPEVVMALPREKIAKDATALELSGDTNLEGLPTQRLAQLQAIYDGAPVGLCFLDKQLRHLGINRRLAEMDGTPMSGYLGRTAKEMAPELYAAAEPFLLRALQGEVVNDVEVVIPGLDGAGEQTRLVSYQPVWDDANEVIGISVAVVDVSEIKRRETIAREAECHYQHMIDASPQIPWIMDWAGNDVPVGAQWVQGEEIQGDSRLVRWLEGLHPSDLLPTMNAINHALRTCQRIDVEYRARTFDGDWRWMRSSGSPHLGVNGEVDCWYGSVEDIHQRKELEKGWRESDAQLRSLFEAIRNPLLQKSELTPPWLERVV